MRARALLVVTLLCAACGGAEPAPRRPAAIGADFDRAAARWRVPVEVLLGVGWVETRWNMHPGEESLDHGFGLMHLVDNDSVHTLSRAGELTGRPRAELIGTPGANIDGAAAVLRELADRVFEDPRLDERRLADWFEVVGHYPGTDSPELAESYSAEVFRVIRGGTARTLAPGEELRLPPTAVEYASKIRFARRLRSLETPAADKWAAASASNFTSGRGGNAVSYIVIHTTQGSYSGAISWFENPSAQVSAHFVVRASDGEITQMVSVNDTAWHAGNWTYNQKSVGIEHEGYITDPAWATVPLYQKSAALSAWICNHFGIPKVHSGASGPGLLGHVEVPGATHTDPGAYWDWNYYMGLVTGGGSNPTTGQLKGQVYEAPDTTKVLAGAKVSISGGASAITDASGNFSFDLAGGSYTYTASLAGYGSASLTRVVTVGQVVWGSVGLSKTVTTEKGCYWGGVFYGQFGDKSQPLTAAKVTLSRNGSTVGTVQLPMSGRSDSIFMFDGLDASQTYTATAVDAKGTAAQTRTILAASGACTSATATWGSIWVGDTSRPPSVAISSPLPVAGTDGKIRTDLASISLTGTATGSAGIAKDRVVVKNVTSGASTTASYDGVSSWSGEITLAQGENKIDVIATDRSGVSSTPYPTQTTDHGISELTVIFTGNAAGVDGTVVDQGTKSPVSGVSLTLGNGATDVTGADGKFALDLTPADLAGRYTLLATKLGYYPFTAAVEIQDGKRTPVQVEIVRAPDIVFTTPDPNQVSAVNVEKLGVQGMVSYDDVLSVALTVDTGDHVAAQTGVGSTFSGTVTLKPGPNLISAAAVVCSSRDASRNCASQNTVTGSVKVTYAPVKGGCGCGAPGAGLLAFALLPALRRRRG